MNAIRPIVTYLQLGRNGRLGNSLFQIAATIGYAESNGMDYIFPKWEYNKYLQFPLPEEVIKVKHQYREPCFEYSPIPKYDGNIDLFGFFQSEKYFKHCANIIRHHFQVKYEHVANFDWRVFRNKTCSIHVRHGDYLNDPHTNAYHGVLSKEYYEQAIKLLFGDNIEDITFIICSDDISWCKQVFNFPKMIFPDQIDVVDLDIMSSCNYNILANSSLSWWVAWLNMNSEKIVAPKHWFNVNLNTKDLYCDGWVKI